MKYCGSLYVALNKEETVKFYTEIFGVEVVSDFGTNFTFTGGFSFQTIESWAGFIEKTPNDVVMDAKNGELYFESEDLEQFIQNLIKYENIKYIHEKKEHEWGQRGLRIYDPNSNIIEVSESLGCLCKRLLKDGMTIEEISTKTYLPVELVQQFLSE